MKSVGRANVQDLIDGAPLSAFQIRAVMLILVVILVDGYGLLIMAAAVPSIAAEWSVPSSSFGFILAAASIGLAAGALIVAPLADVMGGGPSSSQRPSLSDLPRLRPHSHAR